MNTPIPFAFRKTPLFGITVEDSGRLEVRDYLTGDQIPKGADYSLVVSCICEWGRLCEMNAEYLGAELAESDRKFLQAGLREQVPQCSDEEIRSYILGSRLGDHIYGPTNG